LHEPVAFEYLYGLLDGRPSDSEHPGQLSLRRQGLACRKEAEINLPAYLLRRVFVSARLLDRFEMDVGFRLHLVHQVSAVGRADCLEASRLPAQEEL
jgi:hypothetical protein